MGRAFLIFGTMLILASLAFGQADSCNMSLVDEWTAYTPGRFGNLGLDIAGNYIIAAVKTQVFVLEIDSTGALSFVDSLNKDYEFVDVYDDTICFFMRSFGDSTHILTYTIDGTGTLDSLGFFSLNGDYEVPVIDDSLYSAYSSHGSYNSYVAFNIKDVLSPSLVFSVNIPYDGDFTYAYVSNYPLIFAGGHKDFGVYPHSDYTRGRINVLNASDPDSIYVANRFYTELGSHGHSTKVQRMALKDSILYVGGRNLDIKAYIVSSNGTSSSYLTSFGDAELFGSSVQDIAIFGNILYTASTYMTFFDISDPDTIDMIGYYRRDRFDLPYYIYYYDICKKDSFAISLGVQTESDSIRISVMKIPDTGSSGNCELDIKPQNLDLKISPNPFNSSLQITAAQNATITIHDTQGRTIADLGTSRIWNAGDDVASGVYIVRAVVGDEEMTGKVVLLR